MSAYSASSEKLDDQVYQDLRKMQASAVYDVVIIGAGWAGLGAARTLQSKGQNNFLVLEAEDSVGGRCRTVEIDGDTTAELGCQWIHGATTANPVYNIATSSGIATIESIGNVAYYSDVFGGERPHRVPSADIRTISRTHYTNGFIPFQARLQDSTNQDQSLRQTADKYISNKNLEGDTRLGFEYALDTNIPQNYAASLEDLLFVFLWNRWDSDSQISGSDHLIEQGPGKGYSGVLSHYAAPLANKISYDSTVTSINWSSSSKVAISYTKAGQTVNVEAKKVILTVPLGVLQKGSISFAPALPSWKLQAINKLGMGVYNKVIMRWNDDDTLPWPSDVEWLNRIASLGDQGHWTEFFNLKPATGKQVLVAFSAGRESERVEALSDDSIKSEVMESLEAMFGTSSVPEPEQVVITRWKANPLSAGAYSYYKLGSAPKHRTDLGKALGSRLFFAGEACHLKYMSTTHGALMSGQSAANAVVTALGTRSLRGSDSVGASHPESGDVLKAAR
eukprot:CCRYP_019949-RA/>CCRYP_019949-RA protein AED:0.13 eAED:0.13 QI:0/0.5/0.33/1/1/1/3/568/506